MKGNNEIQKNPYPYSNITFTQIKYKTLAKNIDQLKKDFNFFLGKNKTLKRFRTRAANLNTQMNKLINKLTKDKEDHGSLIKSLNMNIEGKNRRFMSAKEIEKYREKKKFLLKIISRNNEKNKTATNFYKYNRYKKENIKLKKLKINNKFNNTMEGFTSKNYKNFKREFRTSLINQSLDDRSLISSILYNENKYKKINNNRLSLEDNKPKNKNLIKIQKRFSLFNVESTKNKNSLKLNLDEYKVEEQKNNYFKIKNSKKGFSSISLNIDNNAVTPNDKYNLRRKIYLKRLRNKVDRFENSRKYYPNDEIIHKNMIDPFIFFKRKNLSQLELNIFGKEENKIDINKRMRLRQAKINPKIRLNKTLTPSRKDNYKLTSKSKDKNNNTNIIIKKLNIIKQGANDKKINMKTLYNNNNYVKRIVNYFSHDEKKMINKSLGKDIKKDALKYKNDLGNFMYIDGKFLFAAHLPHIQKGEFNINDL